MRILAIAALLVALAAAPAIAAEMRKPAPEGYQHAMINFTADAMTVSEKDGGILIVLEGLDPVATTVADIGGRRLMAGFLFRDGPASGELGYVLAQPPLVTNPKASAERISLEDAGTARLTLVEMVEPAVTDGRISLVAEGTPIAAGTYQDIAVMTECLIR